MTEIPLTILLIEDNPGDAHLIRDMLLEGRGTPVDLECVDRLSTGLERLAAGGIDGVLLDLSLPDSEGLDTFIKVHARVPHVPIIVLTGLNDEAVGMRAVQEGAQDYLVKGQVDGHLLVRALRYAIERKRAEDEIRILAKFPAESPNPVLRVAKDGTILYINKAGLPLVNVWGCETGQSLPNDVHLPIGEVLHSGLSKNLELEIRDRIFSFVVAPVVDADCVYIYGEDVTERKQAEADLQAARDYAENLIDSSSDMIISVSVHRNIVEFNRAAEDAFGYTKAEVLGKPVHLLYADPSEGALVRASLVKYGRFTGEVTNKRKNGEAFRCYLSASVIRDADGKVEGAMGISRDITERKRAEEALQETNRRLEDALAELTATQQQVLEQERLRALGQMASGIAHDFNNVLSPILGYSELLLDRPENLDDKEKVTRYLHMMNTAAKDAASVVRRLREFYRSREEDEILLPVDLNQLVEHAINLTQPRWKDQALASGITIDIEADLQNVPLVTGNEAEIREVLANLILNAVDAMPEGGTITVRTRPEGDHVVLEVRDTGTGMTDEVRQRCLEPFFSTKGKRGTGLGLAVVYGIIQRHHGTLTIESEPGRGTAFIIQLPIHPKQEVEDTSQGVAAPSRRLRVLVVDDEPRVREVVTQYLIGDGHSVETASNGSEGLEKFLAGWFDVVVADKGMPGMSGDQLAPVIKGLAPDKPIILLTGFGDLMIASGEMLAGVDIIVSKPVTLTELRQALAKVTGE